MKINLDNMLFIFCLDFLDVFNYVIYDDLAVDRQKKIRSLHVMIL